MTSMPAISICIPAYRNIPYLTRLLDSIAVQTFRDYEVIITDDTPDNSVETLVQQYTGLQGIRYYKNQSALGTPENWNEAIRRANGQWIKLMHNDDWFTSPNALQKFYTTSKSYPDTTFFFSAFQNIVESAGKKEVVTCTIFDRLFLWLSPLHLFKRVYVGNPSCTFIKKDIGFLYDQRFKFVVDFEYYIRCIRAGNRYHYIDEVLLNIGFHDEQVTKYTFGIAKVQIPENYMLLETMGAGILRNPFVYDYYWRMFRNLGIRSTNQTEQYYKGTTHPLLKKMIMAQSKISPEYLKKGIISKLLMSVHYFLSLFYKH